MVFAIFCAAGRLIEFVCLPSGEQLREPGPVQVSHPAVGRMRAVLHLDPVLAFAAAIGAAAMLRDDAFAAHAAGGTE